MGKKKKIKEENIVDEKVVETNEESTTENEKKEVQPSPEEILQQQYDELNNKYLRLYSEFDNYRKRTVKEKGELIANASASVIENLLSILDDFERAMVHNKDSEDANSIKEGFELIHNKLNTILSEKGLKPMESKGAVFDSDHHEAITNIPVQDENMKGKVVDVIEKGYYLNDKVLRYAKVVVGQ